jgi:hypothetical protein
MRRVRLTYKGASHHGMNRGINGENIFERSQNKSFSNPPSSKMTNTWNGQLVIEKK